MNKILAALLIAILFIACHNEQANLPPPPTQPEVKEALIKSHQMYIKQEQDEIAQYIKRHNFTMEATQTGIYYMITEHGKGEQAAVGDIATVTYDISLLNGTTCYDSKDKPVQVLVGKDAVESGVHQAIELMHDGDKGIFIIPSYLAHGLVGDRDKIPPGSVVIYNISLLSVKKPKGSDTNSKK